MKPSSILDKFTIIPGKYAPGSDLEFFTTTDILQCAEKCDQDTRCGNFAFNGSGCFIKEILKDDAYTGNSDEWNTYVLRKL